MAPETVKVITNIYTIYNLHKREVLLVFTKKNVGNRSYCHPDFILSDLQFSLFRDNRKKLNNKKSSNI